MLMAVSMATPEQLHLLCYKEDGTTLKAKNECRAAMINMLILDEMMDIDAAEDLADKTLRDLDLWGDPKPDWLNDASA